MNLGKIANWTTWLNMREAHRSAPSAAPANTVIECHGGRGGNWLVTGSSPEPDKRWFAQQREALFEFCENS
jgi:hypothetical protein